MFQSIVAPLIAPSLLSADCLNLQQDVEAITQAGADWLHIDVMDGKFVPNLAFSSDMVRSLRKITSLPLDVHLMVESVELSIDLFSNTGADSLTFHPEATYHPYRCLQKIKQANLKAGIALNPGTPLEWIYPLLDQLDLVLIMTVNPGFGGQSFLPSSLKKISQLRRFLDQECLNIQIQVDGGINADTAALVVEAGADIIVSGSYLFSSTEGAVKEAYRERVQKLKEAGKSTTREEC